MIIPRNTLIAVRLIEQAEKTVGAITIPTAKELYCEAEILAVGPGNVQAQGGRSETHDLRPGQRVLIQHKSRSQRPGMPDILQGVRYQDGESFYHLFEQTNILAIIAEPANTGESANVSN